MGHPRTATVAAILGAFVAYGIGTRLTWYDPFANGLALWHLEATLGIQWEPALERLISDTWVEAAATAYYLPGHAAPFIGLGLWMIWRMDAAARAFRDAALTSILLGFAFYIVVPVAPPRLVPETGIQGVGASGLDGPIVGWFANDFAAFPSEHAAWACLVLWGLVRFVDRRWAFYAVPHLVWTLFLVLATGHHYVLDVLGGFAVAAVGIWVGETTYRIKQEPQGSP